MNFKEKRTFKKVKKENTKKKVKSNSSDSDGESEHELFFYANDKVQLMKEVLKTLKSKKIKSLAPDELKGLDIEEINTMLLEELLGISNKRLKKIFDGQNADDESSSSEEEPDRIDVISLDDISDDEDFCFVDESPSEKNKKDPKNDKSKNSKKHKIKKEPKDKEIKKEKLSAKLPGENEKLLSVLELLELQARARAIRSQLALEAENKAKEINNVIEEKHDSDSDDAVIVESPKLNEIVISSSESEKEKEVKTTKKKTQKIKINRSRIHEEIEKEESIKNVEPNIAEEDKTLKDVQDKEDKPVEDIPLPNGNKVADTVESEKVDENIEKENVENVVSQKERDSNREDGNNDSDADVINLDAVEIEGIDD